MSERYPIPTWPDGKKARGSFICGGCNREHPLHPDAKQFNCVCKTSTLIAVTDIWAGRSQYGDDVKPHRFSFVKAAGGEG